MGWKRTLHYYRHRMFRTGDSTYKITAGLAMGAAVSFTPFLGTHILQAIFFSWLIRASAIAGLVGTFIGNPWTYPAMFLAAYKLGLWVCVFFGLADYSLLPEQGVITGADHDPWAFFQQMMEHPLKIFMPLAVGGYLCAVVSWPLFFMALYYPVRVFGAAYVRKHCRGGGRRT